jgi:hypothetical protein
MISELILEADELGHLLLSRGLRKVKDLQPLLWGERGACRGDEVTDVFNLWETKLGLLGVDSDVRSAKALEYLSDVTEKLHFGFAVYEYIVDVYFAYSVNKSVEDLVLHMRAIRPPHRTLCHKWGVCDILCVTNGVYVTYKRVLSYSVSQMGCM